MKIPSLVNTLLIVALPLAACSTLPSAGPGRRDIASEQRQAAAPAFALIDLSRATLAAEATPARASFVSTFGGGSTAPAIVIGVGDAVTVEIWETGSDPLFAARSSASGSTASRNASLPEQTVGPDGSLYLPFAGRVNVAGRTAIEVEQLLTAALHGKASRPQVLVQVKGRASTVTVVGDAGHGSRVPLSIKGERLLDVLAAAGGTRTPSYETRIQLTRGSTSLTLPLQQLLQSPAENIYLQAGDVVVVIRQPQSFTAFGATGRNAQIEFGAAEVSLIEAVAKTGGLLDHRADPRGVYLLRYEPAAKVQGLQAEPGDETRVIYQLDLTQVGSYFVAQRFALQDRDMLYVSSAATNELQKFLELVGLVSQPVIQGAVVRGALK